MKLRKMKANATSTHLQSAMNSPPSSTIFSFFRRWQGLQSVLSGAVFAASLLLPVRADSPAWWSTPGIFRPGAAPDDYAVINQGQLKNLAAGAVAEMNIKLPEGAGNTLNELVGSWSSPTVTQNDFAVVNLGQLKNTTKPFYDRIAGGLASSYPWTGAAVAPNDYVLANIGQTKMLFSFAISFTPPSAWLAWLTQRGLPANTPLNGPSGVDGLSNWQLYKRDTLDTDEDGVSDVAEIIAGTSPESKDNPEVELVAHGYVIP